MTALKANLLFSPADLLNELGALRLLAERFLETKSLAALDQLTWDIKGLVGKEREITLSIPEDQPLQTRVSVGKFEPLGKSSSRRIVGKISGIWELVAGEQKVQDPVRPSKKTKTRSLIGFSGLASTTFQVFDEGCDKAIACWKMELGDENSPGCFFHTFSAIDKKFPVPRHPNLFATPMSAIAFAIGELFQTEWERALSGASDPPSRWRSIQRQRLIALLRWQLGLVERATSNPWCELKRAKPEPGLFLL